MPTAGPWIMGGLAGSIGVLGLLLSAHAEDAMIHYTGLLFFVAAVLFVFSLIGRDSGRS